MPGELQDENTSQNVGRYETKYPTTGTGEWMGARIDSVPSEEETKKVKDQANRVLKSMVKKAYKQL